MGTVTGVSQVGDSADIIYRRERDSSASVHTIIIIPLF